MESSSPASLPAKDELLTTIESPLRIGVKDTLRTIGFNTKNTATEAKNEHHIGADLEKFEEKLIHKRKPKID